MDVPPYESPKKHATTGGLKKQRAILARARAAYKRLGKTRAIGLLLLSLATIIPAVIIGVNSGAQLARAAHAPSSSTISFVKNGGFIIYIEKYVESGGMYGACQFSNEYGISLPSGITFKMLDAVNFNKLLDHKSYTAMETDTPDNINKVYWSTKMPHAGYYYMCFFFSFSSGITVRATGSFTIDSSPPLITCNVTQGQQINDSCTITVQSWDGQVGMKSFTMKINGLTRISTSATTNMNITWPRVEMRPGLNHIELIARDKFDSTRTITIYTRGYNYTAPQATFGAIQGVVFGMYQVPVIINRTDDIQGVQLFLNNTLHVTVTGAAISATTYLQWNSRASGNGVYDLKVVVTDFLGNHTDLNSTIVSDNDYINPTLNLSSTPTLVLGPFIVSVSLHDDRGLQSISFYMNQTLIAHENITGCDAIINFTWDPGNIITGNAWFIIVVVDVQGNVDLIEWGAEIAQLQPSDETWKVMILVVIIALIAVLAVAYAFKRYKVTHPSQPVVQAPALAASFQPTPQPMPPIAATPATSPWNASGSAPSTILPPSSFHDILQDITIPDPTQMTLGTTPPAQIIEAPAAPVKPTATDATLGKMAVSQENYGELRIDGRSKVPRAYIDPSVINAQAGPVSKGAFTRIGASGKIEGDLFCTRCHEHILVQEYDPERKYTCTTCHEKLSELAAPVALHQRDIVKLDPARLDCVEIMTCLFNEGYFTRSGRLHKKTIQKLQDDGKISVHDLPKLIDLLLSARILQGITREMVYIDPEIMKVSDEMELSKKVLDHFDEYDEKIASFRF